MTTFLDACVHGTADLEEVHDWIDSWHDTGGAPEDEDVALWTYLGMSEQEYDRWLHDVSALKAIIAEHRRRAFAEAG
jgi:hypothetical protein